MAIVEKVEKFPLGPAREVFRTNIFKVEERHGKTHDNLYERNFSTLAFANWVNVVAVTPNGEIILVEQHRIGTDSLTLETPGGAVDPGEKDFTMAALRELEEETGYTSQRILALPGYHPNPAIQGNKITYFIALDAQPIPKNRDSGDPFECIQLHFIPIAEALKMARTGQMSHALCSLAILLAEPYLSSFIAKNKVTNNIINPKWKGSVCVFCAASDGQDPRYLKLAQQTGEALASLNLRLVYGGAKNGLMGAVADGALSQNGEVYGVLPKVLEKFESAHAKIQTLEWTENMAERKEKLLDKSDLFLVLPGGMGTLDELFEVITMNSLGFMNKPLVIFDAFDFYTPLLNWLETVNYKGFCKPPSEMFSIVRTIDELITFLK